MVAYPKIQSLPQVLSNILHVANSARGMANPRYEACYCMHSTSYKESTGFHKVNDLARGFPLCLSTLLSQGTGQKSVLYLAEMDVLRGCQLVIGDTFLIWGPP
jgi:hypothetical protein